MTNDIQELLSVQIKDCLEQLKTTQKGLDSEEIQKRLEIFGSNEIVKKKKQSGPVRFLLQLKNPLIIILLFAAIVSIFFGSDVNAIIIFVIILGSMIIDFYQTTKSENAAEMLKKKVETTSTLFRDNRQMEVSNKDIVPGDIIRFSAGDNIPADCRIIEQKDLAINQSALTGEAFPVEKNAKLLNKQFQNISEWNNCLFMGTFVISGTATGVVIRTGLSTEYGKIAKELIGRPLETEFERSIRKFGLLIMQITFILVIFVFFFNTLSNKSVIDSLLFSVALAVGLTPDLLPMIVTINLSKGAIEMSKKDVIVKRLEAIQNIGSMDILCTDKTGTLTKNEITLVKYIDADGREDEKILLHSYLNSYFQTGLKSALDKAILKFKAFDVSAYQKLDEIPFDFTRRKLSIVAKLGNIQKIMTKGAYEEIKNVCSQIEIDGKLYANTEEKFHKIDIIYDDLSKNGFRILAICYKNIDLREEYSVNDENDMIFLGLTAFLDPPKETASETLKLFKEAKIEVKIITGDNEQLTAKICKDLDFEIKNIATGNDIQQMNDDNLAIIVEKTNIFSRVTPIQKFRILSALKRNGHTVGFLGDGINDAPSLKNADVGISVDNAVDVAKDSADMILLKSSLRVIYEAVLAGRKTFGNTMKYMMMGLSSNFGNMLSVSVASIFLPFLPMLPVQILLNNLLYDISETSIPSDNVDVEYLMKPKKLEIKFLRKFMIYIGSISSVFDFLTFAALIFLFHATPQTFRTGWFIESICTQLLVVFIIRTNIFPFFKSKPSKTLLFWTLLITFVGIYLPFSPLRISFQFIIPPIGFFMFMIGIIIIYLFLVEMVKRWFYKRNPI